MLAAMNDSVVFVRRSSGGGCYALILVFAIFPVMGLLHAVLDEDQKNVGAAVVFGLAALAFLVWQAVRDEHRLELDARRVRFVERQTWFGVTRPETVLFDVALDETSRVTQVNTRTPSSRGGWNYGSHLVFPGDHNVTDYFLGSREDPASEYNRLTKTLKERLGDRFTVEEKV